MRFDGLSVETYQGRFSGAFDVETKDGETFLKYGNTVILLVVGTVGQAVMKEDKLGDMMRTSTVIVDTAEFVAPEDLSTILTQLGVSHQLSLTVPTPPVAFTDDDSFDGDDGHIVTPDGVVSQDGDIVDLSPDGDSEFDGVGMAEDLIEHEVAGPPGGSPLPDLTPGERQVVGRVRPPRDPALARFISGGVS